MRGKRDAMSPWFWNYILTSNHHLQIVVDNIIFVRTVNSLTEFENICKRKLIKNSGNLNNLGCFCLMIYKKSVLHVDWLVYVFVEDCA